MDPILIPYLTKLAGYCSDDEEAIESYRKLAKMGYPHAMTELAVYYMGNINLDKAKKWFEEAIKYNHPRACWIYADAYFFGSNGFEMDLKKALYYYDKAAELDDVYPCSTINCHRRADVDGGWKYVFTLYKRYLKEGKNEWAETLKNYCIREFKLIFIQKIIELDDENNQLQEEIKQLRDRIIELEYRPGNPGYEEAKRHFKKMKKNIYKDKNNGFVFSTLFKPGSRGL